MLCVAPGSVALFSANVTLMLSMLPPEIESAREPSVKLQRWVGVSTAPSANVPSCTRVGLA